MAKVPAEGEERGCEEIGREGGSEGKRARARKGESCKGETERGRERGEDGRQCQGGVSQEGKLTGRHVGRITRNVDRITRKVNWITRKVNRKKTR
jgi:hypothetical protein